MKKISEKTVDKFITAARDLYEREGEVEVDDPTTRRMARSMISACDDWEEEGGVYVKAWVWVPIEEVR